MVNEIESARWAEVVSPPNDVDAQLGELEVPATVLARRHGMTMAVLSQNSRSASLNIAGSRRPLTPGLPRQQHADLLEELLGQARLDDVGIAASQPRWRALRSHQRRSRYRRRWGCEPCCSSPSAARSPPIH